MWKGWLALAAIGLLLSMGMWGWILLLFLAPKFLNKLNRKVDNLGEIDSVPYWGRVFGLKQTIKLLAVDRLKPYVMKNGKKCKKVLVSQSGRWIYVSGRFYPLSLISSFDKTKNKLTMINNVKLKDQYWLGDEDVADALQEILLSKKNFLYNGRNKAKGEDCERAFKRVWHGNLKDIGKADWDELRYRWEQELADIEAEMMERSTYNKHMEGLEGTKNAKAEMYGRVLLDMEIKIICDAVREGKIKNTTGWFDFSLFKNDMCVMNGVKLAKVLGYPLNEEAAEFLFTCISDIQKPYFEEAVSALETFPREILIPLIEKYVSAAHEEGDVVFGAGLLYLSKRIGYEISLKRDQAEEAPAEEKENEFEKRVLLAQGRM